MHSRMKRNAANAYSLTAVLQQEPYADHVSEKLFAQLDGEADKGLSNVFDLGKYMHAYAMDAIFMISFGRSLNILEEGDKHKVMACFDTIMPYMATVCQLPAILEREADVLIRSVKYRGCINTLRGTLIWPNSYWEN